LKYLNVEYPVLLKNTFLLHIECFISEILKSLNFGPESEVRNLDPKNSEAIEGIKMTELEEKNRKKLRSEEMQTSSREMGSAPPKVMLARDNSVKGTKWVLNSLNNKSVLKIPALQ